MRSLLLVLLMLLVACGSSQLVPPSATRSLGLIEISFAGNGSSLSAFARPINASLSTQSLSDASAGIQLELISKGVFDVGKRGVDGQRYLSATFKVRNADSSARAYAISRQNLSFIAASTPSSLVGSAIQSLVKFDDSPAESALALLIKPTHGMAPGLNGPIVQPNLEDFQAYTESEVASLGALDGVSSLLPYGFVARCVTNCLAGSRALVANPAPGQFDGRVTFAVRLPLQASPKDDPFKFSLLFEVVDDSTTRVTQSLEEQSDPAPALARAAALNGAQLLGLSGSDLPTQTLCSLRTAGAASFPTATLVDSPVVSGLPGFANQMFVAPGSAIAADFDRAMRDADNANFVVSGSLTGQKPGLYSGATSGHLSFVPDPFRPDPSSLYPPNERLEVSLTRGLSAQGNGAALCSPYTFQFRTRVSVRSDGQFRAVQSLSLGDAPRTLLTADFNADGLMDLAVSFRNTSAVAILLNQGNAQFRPAINLNVSHRVFALASADFNRDGRLDLAVDSSQGLAIYLGDSTGQFTPGFTFSSGMSVFGLEAADLNGDGLPDLAAVGFDGGATQGKLVTLIGLGDGRFQSRFSFTRPRSLYEQVQAADLNNDGKLDLILRDGDGLDVLFGNGDGRFRPAQRISALNGFISAMEVADINQDGILDLITLDLLGDTIQLRLGLGDGRFNTTNLGTKARGDPQDLKVADLNGDGKLDLISRNLSLPEPDNVSVYLAGSLLSYPSTSIYDLKQSFNQFFPAVGMQVVDLNGDGKLDLVLPGLNNNLSLLLQP